MSGLSIVVGTKEASLSEVGEPQLYCCLLRSARAQLPLVKRCRQTHLGVSTERRNTKFA